MKRKRNRAENAKFSEILKTGAISSYFRFTSDSMEEIVATNSRLLIYSSDLAIISQEQTGQNSSLRRSFANCYRVSCIYATFITSARPLSLQGVIANGRKHSSNMLDADFLHSCPILRKIPLRRTVRFLN